MENRARLMKILGKVCVLFMFGIATAAGSAGSNCSPKSDAQVPTKKQAAPAAPNSPSAKAVSSEVVSVARLGDAFAEVAEAASKSVVSIRIESKQPRMQSPFGFFFGFPQGEPNGQDYNIVRGSGSGVIISTDGFILTNNHVVEKATRIEVKLRDNRRFKAKVVGTDPATDLAVVKIEAKGLPAARLADSSSARVGEWVIAIGSPFGLDYTVTAGVLSAIGRGGLGANDIEDYLQTDASINPGNSGGPLVNLRGEVLGINTMIVGRGTGIGFAIPSTLAQHVAKQLTTQGKVSRGWIGVGFQELTPELAERFKVKQGSGALISSVMPNSPAAKAGLRTGDVVVAVNGKPIVESHGLLRAVIEKPIGSKIQLTITRDGHEQRMTLTTAQRPGDLSKSKSGAWQQQPQNDDATQGYGLNVEPLTPELRQRLGIKINNGVIVAQVQEGSPADRAGLKVGDVIVEADRQPVTRVQQLASALQDGSALLRVERREGSFFTVLSRDSE